MLGGFVASGTASSSHDGGHVAIAAVGAPGHAAETATTGATTTTATTATTTTTAPTRTLPAGAVVPKVSLGRPVPATLIARTPRTAEQEYNGETVATYRIKAGRPVTWWYTIRDKNGRMSYSVNVYAGTAGSRLVAGSGVMGVYHQPLVAKRWIWQKPARGTYRVCAIAIDLGPVRGGANETCQLVSVVR
jgi:hypothetical protein